jgi:hypothetical protein
VIDRYDWSGGREAMLRFGPDSGPVVVAALPLFEEANRTRSFAVTVLRALAAKGVAGALPDLPGQGESLVPLHKTSVLAMQDAFAFACDKFDRERRPCYALAIRSGALLDATALVKGRWHFAPLTGPQLVRELVRIKQAELGSRTAEGDAWTLDAAQQGTGPVEIAGTAIPIELLRELQLRMPYSSVEGRAAALRTVRLASDMRPADLRIDAAPLWRRAEPGNDPALAEQLADDIAAWVRACES